ncbi:hypothetical protein GDO86_015341 [Hymenochirus boettgeri]|uniref:Uncharacterized protein n=1 Tax=Hymenochirus boettgeri TaxID=247094 RepID=A0A8T2JW62_9PIPI|nr:hypothetical protein GDO86_015341 [Hymenochirus boettgeri]
MFLKLQLFHFPSMMSLSFVKKQLSKCYIFLMLCLIGIYMDVCALLLYNDQYPEGYKQQIENTMYTALKQIALFFKERTLKNTYFVTYFTKLCISIQVIYMNSLLFRSFTSSTRNARLLTTNNLGFG